MQTQELTSALAGGMAAAGRFLGRTARSAGRSLAAGYHAIDPDVRRHLAQLPLGGLSMLLPRQGPLAALPDDGHAPLLLVHGLGGHPGNFLAMRAWMRLLGRSRIYAMSFPPGASLQQMALAVRRRVARIAALNHTASIDVVAHSMGGLVVRLALNHQPTRARLRTLVTLGTPHHGTQAARFGATKAMRALRPGSPTLRLLEKQLPWSGPRLVCFWSESDVMLLPAKSACVDGAENVELPGFTHFNYLLDPRAASRVVQALDLRPSRAAHRPRRPAAAS